MLKHTDADGDHKESCKCRCKDKTYAAGLGRSKAIRIVAGNPQNEAK